MIKRRIIMSVTWGACMFASFVMADRLHKATMDILNSKNFMEAEEIFIEEESE